MPTVTPYGASKVGSTVASAARRSNVSQGTFGVATPNAGVEGQAISNVGGGIKNFSDEIARFAERVDLNTAEDSIVGFEREKNAFLTNYSTTRGKDAFESADNSKEELEKLRRKYSDDISSTRARSLFNKNTDAQMTRAIGSIDQHAVSQFDEHERTTLGAQIENTIEAASLYWDDPAVADVQRGLGIEHIKNLGGMNGDSPETIAESVETYDSQFSIAVVESALSVSAIAGESALNEFSESIEGPSRVNLQISIERARKTERTQQAAEGAVISSTDLVNRLGDLPNAKTLGTAEINEKYSDPVERSAAHREFAYQLNQKQIADSQFAAATYDDGLKFLTDPEGGSIDQFISANPEGWDAMSAAQQSTLKAGTSPVTDFAQLSDILLLPQGKLAKVTPSDYVGVFANADISKLTTAVKSARSGSDSQLGRSETAQVTAAINSTFGFGKSTPKDYSNRQREQVNAYYALITAEQVKWKEDNDGRDMTSAEMDNMLGQLAITKTFEDAFFYYDAEYGLKDIEGQYYDDIAGALEGIDNTPVTGETMGFFKPIIDRLVDDGIPVTSENLIEAYRQGKQ